MEERSRVLRKAAFRVDLLHERKGPRLARFVVLPRVVASEEVVSLHHPVPRLGVGLAPDALPVAGDVGAEDVFLELLRIGIELLHELADSVGGSVEVVVAGHEKALHLVPVGRKVVRKHLAPGGGVELHLRDLPDVRHVPEVEYGVHVLRPEAPERGDEPFVGPVLLAVLPVRGGPQVGVAHDAEDEIGVLRRLPAGRRGEEPRAAAERPCAERGRQPLQKTQT